jgi:hypothetical protein
LTQTGPIDGGRGRKRLFFQAYCEGFGHDLEPRQAALANARRQGSGTAFPANNPALPACAIARHRRRLQSLRPAGEPVHRCLQPDQRVIPKSGNRFFGRDHAQSKDLGEMTNQREVIPLEA